MASLVRELYMEYDDLMNNRSDPRVKNWLLMSSPWPTLLLCAAYVYFVKSLGPRLMEKRKPFDLKATIMAYNFVQVVASAYMVYKIMAHAWLTRYSLRCQPVDYSNDPDEMIVASLVWWYYFCKFTEFLDTVFFVLRKKNDQITNLHVIHHTIMPISTWFAAKFTPGGHAAFCGTLNTFVHVIMYTYYLLAAMGPRFRKYLWWKKYLTRLQMAQFIIVFIHSVQLFFIDCNFPKALAYIMCFNALMFLGLFSNFYVQAYIKRRRLPVASKQDSKAVFSPASRLLMACFVGHQDKRPQDKDSSEHFQNPNRTCSKTEKAD